MLLWGLGLAFAFWALNNTDPGRAVMEALSGVVDMVKDKVCLIASERMAGAWMWCDSVTLGRR